MLHGRKSLGNEQTLLIECTNLAKDGKYLAK